MKPRIKRSVMLGLLLGMVLSLLFSCKKQKEVVAPRPDTEEAISIQSEPVEVKSPEIGDEVAETATQLFPKNLSKAPVLLS